MKVDFVFFYGLLPVATSVLAIAQAYRIDSELRASFASALVLGKLVAFLLLAAAAYVITFGSKLMGLLSTFSAAMHSLSVLGCVYLLTDSRHYTPERRSLLAIAVLQASYSTAFLLSRVFVLHRSPETKQALPQFAFQALFVLVSLLRWSCHGWIMAMCYDQCRRARQGAAELRAPPFRPPLSAGDALRSALGAGAAPAPSDSHPGGRAWPRHSSERRFSFDQPYVAEDARAVRATRRTPTTGHLFITSSC